MLSDGLTRRPLTEGIRPIYARGFSGCLEDICENVARVNDSVFVHVAPNQIRDLLALCLQSVVQLVKRVLRAAKIFSEIGKEDFHWLQSSSVQNCYHPLMFEARLQTYWADVDAAGIVYFPHFFRFVEHAEEELFRAAGLERQPLIQRYGIWMPRVEAFSKFSKPIRHGSAIRVRLSPQLVREKT